MPVRPRREPITSTGIAAPRQASVHTRNEFYTLHLQSIAGNGVVHELSCCCRLRVLGTVQRQGNRVQWPVAIALVQARAPSGVPEIATSSGWYQAYRCWPRSCDQPHAELWTTSHQAPSQKRIVVAMKWHGRCHLPRYVKNKWIMSLLCCTCLGDRMFPDRCTIFSEWSLKATLT